MTKRAVVKNAADRKQVGSAEKREKLRRSRELEDLRVVMSTPEGRRVIWRLLSEFKVFGSVMRDGVERVMFLAGKQDAGHLIQGEAIAASEALYLLMQKEAFGDERLEEEIAAIAQRDGKAVTQDNPDEDAQ